MNFFEQQDQARRNTRRLVVLFILAVLAIVAVVDLALLLGHRLGTGPRASYRAHAFG